MIENKKYYGSKASTYLLTLIVFTLIVLYLAIFSMDYSDVSITVLVVLVSFLILDILTLFVYVQTKRQVSYLFYKGDRIYINTLLNKEISASLKNDFTVKRNKGRIEYIVLKKDDMKSEMLFGANFKEYLSDIELLLEKNKSL